MNHHNAARLSSERVVDLQQSQPRPQHEASEALRSTPVQKVARRRVHLPLIARGFAGLEDYYRKS